MAAPAAVPPPIFAGSNSISVFLCYAPHPFRYVPGEPYICVLGKDHQVGLLMDDRGRSRRKIRVVAWPSVLAATPVLVWPPGLRSCDFRTLDHQSSQNIDPRKIPVPFDFV